MREARGDRARPPSTAPTADVDGRRRRVRALPAGPRRISADSGRAISSPAPCPGSSGESTSFVRSQQALRPHLASPRLRSPRRRRVGERRLAALLLDWGRASLEAQAVGRTPFTSAVSALPLRLANSDSCPRTGSRRLGDLPPARACLRGRQAIDSALPPDDDARRSSPPSGAARRRVSAVVRAMPTTRVHGAGGGGLSCHRPFVHIGATELKRLRRRARRPERRFAGTVLAVEPVLRTPCFPGGVRRGRQRVMATRGSRTLRERIARPASTCCASASTWSGLRGDCRRIGPYYAIIVRSATRALPS